MITLTILILSHAAQFGPILKSFNSGCLITSISISFDKFLTTPIVGFYFQSLVRRISVAQNLTPSTPTSCSDYTKNIFFDDSNPYLLPL